MITQPAVCATVAASVAPPCLAVAGAWQGLACGVDLVQISRIDESLHAFGERFMKRLFTSEEIAYALEAPALTSQRLATRFAAKEAAIKAFNLADAGVDWRELEVRRSAEGRCSLALHGKAALWVAESHGPIHTALSLSHEADHACAMLVVTRVQHTTVTSGMRS